MKSIGLLILLCAFIPVLSILTTGEYIPSPGHYYQYFVDGRLYTIEIINETTYNVKYRTSFGNSEAVITAPLMLNDFLHCEHIQCVYNYSIPTILLPSPHGIPLMVPTSGFERALNMSIYDYIVKNIAENQTTPTQDEVETLLAANILYEPLFGRLTLELSNYNFTDLKVLNINETKKYYIDNTTHVIITTVDISINNTETNSTYHLTKMVLFSMDTGHVLKERSKLYINNTLKSESNIVLVGTNDPNLENWASSSEELTLNQYNKTYSSAHDQLLPLLLVTLIIALLEAYYIITGLK